jgi:large subunit ribosomal protein L29
MKLAQFREKLQQSTEAELLQMIQDERKNLFMARRDSATKQLENPRKLMQSRKNIARILTVLRARELESAKGTK